ncbi:MAG: carboxypeptidase-like regulatory domain-containing protein [Gemmatimonadaceae bacterium]|nr:carboxypeptidase-like regulatory domain-containing protein [Gemmatimonadaceae bacterium]
MPALLVTSTTAAHAQRLRLTLVDDAGRAPVGGAIVTVLRADSTRHVEAIVAPSGVRLLSIDMAGTYRLRVRRVGYRPFLSEPITLTAGEERAITLTLPEQRIPLAVVRAVSRARCDVGGAYDGATADALESARTSLLAASLAWREQSEPIEAFTISRQRSMGGFVLDSTRVKFAERFGEPFGSLDAAQLHERGYVVSDSTSATDDRIYALPSPGAMISDAFARTHCFALVDDPRDSTRVGIRFEPLRTQPRADVRGIMWLTRATNDLRAIEFAYTRMSYPGFTPGASGYVRLATLPSGVRIIDAWYIRMPVFGQYWGGAQFGHQVRQTAWKEDGGEARAKPVSRPEPEQRPFAGDLAP